MTRTPYVQIAANGPDPVLSRAAADDELAVDLIVRTTPDETRRAISDAVGEWIAVVDAGDALARSTFRHLRALLDQHPTCDVLYSDEAIARGHEPAEPWYKPDWSPDRYRCQPYLGRLTLVRRTVLEEAGGLRVDLPPDLAEYDLVLRATERARLVAHLPLPLYLRKSGAGEMPAFAPDEITAAARVVDEHLARTQVAARAVPDPDVPGLLRLEPVLASHPVVSIVIPTAATERVVGGERECLVLRCVRSILSRSSYDAIEVLCVTDDVVGSQRREELLSLDRDRVRVVDFEGPFHFSRKINRGTRASNGDVVLFLNDDTEVVTPNWIESMLVYALQPGIGAVGARLLFEDGRIQHSGVVGVRGNPGHANYGLPGDRNGYLGNAVVPGNFLAVTAACLMTRRECFDAVGGMSPWFPVNYNDLDYCLKLVRAGRRVVCTPDVELRHYESASRTGDVAGVELERVRRRWGRLLEADPFYGPNFATGDADFATTPVEQIMSP